MKKKYLKAKSGYTIIETMISVSLFIVVIMSGMGSLLNANFIHLKSQDIRSIMDNLSFVMEDMSRNLRTGYNYRCITGALNPSNAELDNPQSCVSGWAIAFEFADGDDTADFVADQGVYYFLNGRIFKSINGAQSVVQMTPNEVIINAVSNFSVLGAESSATNSQEPFVIIKLVGKIITKNTDSPFSLQTSVSQRLVDI